MIKIVKQGKPLNPTYQIICHKCESVLEFKTFDTSYCQKEDEYILICPCCKNGIGFRDYGDLRITRV